MEKFRSTADPSTGVHPYLPPRLPRTSLPSLLLFPFLIILRLPLLFICFLLHPIFYLPSSPPTRVLHSLLSSLFLFTFSSAPDSILPLHRNSKTPPSKPTANSLVLINLHSPFSLLHLIAIYSPIFLFPTATGLATLSFNHLYTLISTGFLPSDNLPVIDDLSSLLASSRTPVVLLAEGTVTNGCGVLAFVPHALAATARVISTFPVFAMGYNSQKGATYCGVGRFSFAKYLFKVMGRWRTQSCPTCVQVKPAEVRNIQTLVARCALLPPLGVGREGRSNFEKHWKEAGAMSW